MSSVVFTSADLRRIGDTTRVLLAPDGAADSSWPVEANRALKELVSADLATFTIERRESPVAITEDIDARLMKQYFVEWQNVDRAAGLDRAVLALGVCSRRMAWGMSARDLYRSEYYNSLVVPARAFDSLTMAAALRGGGAAKAFVHHGTPTGPKFGSRGLELLRAVYPSFVAGVRAFVSRTDGALANFLDALPDAVLLYSERGRLLHANGSARALLSTDAEHRTIRSAIERVRAALLPLVKAPEKGTPSAPPVADVTTTLATYRVSGCVAPPGILTSAATVRVTIEVDRPSLPSVAVLRERFGLTQAEARVALLLAGRKTNGEIAGALCVSPHTARHHTEKVLLKLGVHGRAEAASLVLVHA